MQIVTIVIRMIAMEYFYSTSWQLPMVAFEDHYLQISHWIEQSKARYVQISHWIYRAIKGLIMFKSHIG